MKILTTGLLAILLVSCTFAQMTEVLEKNDPALGVTIFFPKKVALVEVEKARFNLGHVKFRVYPAIYQAMNKSEKVAILQIDIQGLTSFGMFNNSDVVVTIDGQPATLHLSWDVNNDTFFGDSALTTKFRLLDTTGSFRRIANAKDVYITVLLPSMTPDRYTVHLTEPNLDVVKLMLSKYDELEPRKTEEGNK